MIEYLGEGETLVGGMRPSSVSCLTILVLDKGMNRHYYFMWGGGVAGPKNNTVNLQEQHCTSNSRQNKKSPIDYK
jgi:hypothetical protein